MTTDEEIVEILAAFDLTGSYRKAAALVGCDQHTVPRYVSFARRAKLNEGSVPKIEELVEQSHGKIGADQVH